MTAANGLHSQFREADLTQTQSRARAGDGRGRLGPFLVGESVTIGKSALPSLVFATGGLGAAGMGDITGRGHDGGGAGAAVVGSMLATVYATKHGPRGGIKRKVISRRRSTLRGATLHPSRVVGSELYGAPQVGVGGRGLSVVSFDAPLFESKLEFLRWVDGQDSLPDTLADMLLAVGKRAAIRQASRLEERRGVVPSQTSKDDAAADAVLCILQNIRRLDKSKAAQWQTPRFRRVLALYAARGAFNSLASCACLGMTGDDRFKRKAGIGSLSMTVLDTLQAASDADNAREIQQPARRAMVRWVFQVGFRDFVSRLPVGSKGNAAAIRAARMRCRVVGEIVLGNASLVDACAVSGFASFASFAESCDKAAFWPSLRAARAAAVSEASGPHRAGMTYHAGRAADAIKQFRRIGAAGFDCERLGVAPTRGSALVVRQLLAARAEHLQWATWHRDAAQRADAAELAAFDKVLHGVKSARFGNLRSLVGLTARRPGGRKVDGALVRRAIGKMSKARGEAATLALPVGRHAKMPCTPLAPASVKLLVPYAIA